MTTPRGLIEVLATEARTLVSRPISVDEFEAYVSRTHRLCGHWPEAETKAAFDGWMDQIDPDRNPPRVLPPVRTLAQIRERAKPRTNQQNPHREWQKPRREFVEAHLAFRDRLKRLGWTQSGLISHHDHHRGAAGCPVCGHEGDERRAEIERLLEELPAPVEVPSERCRCDGGWFDDRVGVRPCRLCLPGVYEAWMGGW